MQCTFKNSDESTCTREAISDRGLCILHEDWEHKDEEKTKEAFNREMEEGIRDFQGCILPRLDLAGKTIKGSLNFSEARIRGDASFRGAILEGDAVFSGATIEGQAWFERVEIRGQAWFEKVEIGGNACFEWARIRGRTWFTGAKIGGDALFKGVKIGGYALFSGAKIRGDASFWGATFAGDAWFVNVEVEGNAVFMGVEIEGRASFMGAKIKGNASFIGMNVISLTFEDAIFYDIATQENACREAKVTQERTGDRILADYHFYREMEAKRKQKPRLIRLLESPVQYVFGYGVRPWWVIRSWLLVVLGFALIYWLGQGVQETTSFWDNLYFSVVTAATPGYGGYDPNPGFTILATFQAIFGTFMWAAIIATFARKFMR